MMKTIKETLEQALEALEKLNNTNSHWWQEVDENVIVHLSNAESALRETLTSVPDWASEAIEQPAQRCPLCNYQHGHAIGCKNNPVDIALNKMAENARELGLDYEPAQQEPVAWGIIASNTGRICQVELDADEIQGHNPKYIVPLYTSPPAQRTWVGLTTADRKEIERQSVYVEGAIRLTEAKLKAKNSL